MFLSGTLAGSISAISPLSNAVGVGGQPGMRMSTGTTSATPPATAYDPANTPQPMAQSPAATTHFRRWRCGVGALQRLAHVLGHRAGDEEDVGVAGRGDEAEAEAFEVVEGVVEGVDFELAAIARAGVDLADGKAVAEPPARRRVERACHRGDLGVVDYRRRLGQGAVGDSVED